MASKTQLFTLKEKNKLLLGKIKKQQQFKLKYVRSPEEWEVLQQTHKEENVILVRQFYV